MSAQHRQAILCRIKTEWRWTSWYHQQKVEIHQSSLLDFYPVVSEPNWMCLGLIVSCLTQRHHLKKTLHMKNMKTPLKCSEVNPRPKHSLYTVDSLAHSTCVQLLKFPDRNNKHLNSTIVRDVLQCRCETCSKQICWKLNCSYISCQKDNFAPFQEKRIGYSLKCLHNILSDLFIYNSNIVELLLINQL